MWHNMKINSMGIIIQRHTWSGEWNLFPKAVSLYTSNEEKAKAIAEIHHPFRYPWVIMEALDEEGNTLTLKKDKWYYNDKPLYCGVYLTDAKRKVAPIVWTTIAPGYVATATYNNINYILYWAEGWTLRRAEEGSSTLALYPTATSQTEAEPLAAKTLKSM